MTIGPVRTRGGAEHRLRDVVATAAQPGGQVPLELRLHELHRRRRRAAIRRFITAACWSAGFVGVGAFLIALTIGAAQQ